MPGNGRDQAIGEIMAFESVHLAQLSAEESASVERLIASGVSIPAQPRVLNELQQSVARGVDDVRTLARILAKDPSIVAMLFKVAQSAAFRGFQPFSSVEHIMQVIGVVQTLNLVRAIALAAALPAGKNETAFESYWARSHAVSALAMLIAEEHSRVCKIAPDQACLAGIFHDCGVPLLMQRYPDYCQSIGIDGSGGWPTLNVEDARFDADHCVVGYLVARHWKLPDFICDAIRYHHDMRHVPDEAARRMVAILQLAFEIYYREERISNPEWALVGGDVLNQLDLSEDALSELVDVVVDRYNVSA